MSDDSVRPADHAAYSYLLGAYLGDGCVSVRRTGGVDLRIKLDASYPGIVAEVVSATASVLPSCAVKVRPSRVERSIEVAAASSAWTDLFPQHGAGAKHTRSVRLQLWQQEIVNAHPREFIRGLIHSDGCRTINRFDVALPSGRAASYAYPRYFFSNLSIEIRAMFRSACAAVGVHCTAGNGRNLSVSRRASVALLDSFVGPKA